MHIGLILDGNRRWAKKRGLPSAFGHKKGGENFEKIASLCAGRDDIIALSVYALSTENLLRDPKELEGIFKVFYSYEKKIASLQQAGMKVKFSGNLKLLPEKLQLCFQHIEGETSSGKKLLLQLCVAHGGKDEILRAAQKVHESREEFTVENLEKYLDSAVAPPLDLVIRTGGAQRLSNFLLWQAAYAELYFTETLWPDFDEQALEEAIGFYHAQQRNFGK